MALLAPVHFVFIREVLTEGFVLKNISVATVLWKLLLQWGFVGFKKAIFGYFYQFWVVSRGKCTTESQF